MADGIGISRKTMRIVYQNIVFALGVKLLVLVLAALGIANMWEAIFADVGVSVDRDLERHARAQGEIDAISHSLPQFFHPKRPLKKPAQRLGINKRLKNYTT